MATKDPYLTNLSSSQKDPFLVSLSETTRPTANQQTVQNPDTGASYDLGNIFRMLDINEAGPSAENSERQMAFENYLKGTVLEHASEGKVFDARKRNEDALLISAYTGRDQKDVLDNYDQYVKFFTGNNPGKGVLGAFRDYFDGYYMQKQISNAELALLDIPYDDPRREYYENNLETMRTNHQLKTSDVSNNSEFWRKVASSGNIFAQTAEQLNRTLLASAVFGAIGGAVAPQLGVGMDNLVKAQSIKDAMKLGQSANMLTYTICEMGKAEAAEVASEASRMVDENGNRIPLEVIKEIAYPIGVISALTEIMDDALTPLGQFRLGKRTIGETVDYIKNLLGSNPLGYIGLGVAGTTFQALQEGLQSRIRRLGIDLIVAKSNNQGRTNLPVGNTPEDSLAKWGEALTEFKDSFIPMGVSQLLTGGLSIGATYTTAALSKAMQISPKMRQDASKYFTENGKVYDIGYIDTVGQSPVNIYEPKADKDGKTAEQKRTAPILMYVNKYTGALVPVYTRDRQYVEYLRENGVTGIKGVVISEEALTNAGDNASASDLASILAMRIGTDSPVMGYDGSTIIMDSQEGVEAAIEDIESYKDSLSQNVEFEKQEDGSYRIVWENTRGTSQTITVRAKTESDQMVSQNTETEEATGNVRPVRTMNGEAMNGLFNSTIRKSKDQTLNDAELEMSAKYFYQQLTGLKADEIENLWENDYQAIAEKLPEGVDENTIEQGARFMPLLSSITGRSTEDLLNDPQNRIVLKYLGKAKKARYASGEEGYVAGALNQYKEEDGTNVFEIGLSDIASQTGTELVHELMHVARALAPVERLSGFVGLRGYTGKYGGMWRSDIRQTADGRYRLGARLYDTYEEAAALVEGNEEQFVRDFFEYLRTGEAPNAEVASFFGRLKQFLQSFAREFSKDFSDDTRRAFDMLLNGEVDIQPGQTLEEAVEDSERTLTDDAEQTAQEQEPEENEYTEDQYDAGLDENGNQLWSLAPADVVERFNTEKTTTAYRTMQVIDSELYPPKATYEKGKRGPKLIAGARVGDVLMAEERPEMAYLKTLKDGTTKYVFDLKDGVGTTAGVDYNPYFHSSSSVFNDQFTGANNRPNQVLVEVKLLDSDLNSGYQAEKANKPVGETSWHYGSLSAQLRAANKGERTVYLSRYLKIERIVPADEVASMMKRELEGTDIKIDARTVTPTLRAELEKAGVAIDYSKLKGNTLYSLAENRQWQTMDANTQRRIDDDYERTLNQYLGTDKWMKAPNGQPTKLTERQWVIVRTPAFKAWFGDWENDPENSSRVVDENGEPKIVYHGTNMSGFETFQSGDFGVFFVDDVDVAKTYVYTDRENPNPDRSIVKFDMTSDAEDERLLSGSIYAVFLNMRDPVTYDAKGNPWYDIMGKGVEGVSPDMNDNEESVAAYAAEYSYDENPDNDGTIVQNVRDYGSGDDATVVKPSTVYVIPWGSENQIKSVDNVGTFSGESENILYSLQNNDLPLDFYRNGGTIRYGYEGQFGQENQEGTEDPTGLRGYIEFGLPGGGEGSGVLLSGPSGDALESETSGTAQRAYLEAGDIRGGIDQTGRESVRRRGLLRRLNSVKGSNYSGVFFYELNKTPETLNKFIESLNYTRENEPTGVFVSSKTLEELQKDNVHVFMSGDGNTGYAIEYDYEDKLGLNNLVAVFNNSMNGPRSSGAVYSVLADAIEHGANILDCYADPKLIHSYTQMGFIPTGTVKFTDEYLSDEDKQKVKKNKLGKPSVVTMYYADRDINDTMDKLPGRIDLDVKGLLKGLSNYPSDGYMSAMDERDVIARDFLFGNDPEYRANPENYRLGTRIGGAIGANPSPLSEATGHGLQNWEDIPGREDVAEKIAGNLMGDAYKVMKDGTELKLPSPIPVRRQPGENAIAYLRRVANYGAQNIRTIFNTIHKDVLAREKQWYDTAHAFAVSMAERYNLSIGQSAATIAVLSPNYEWDPNLALADICLDILTNATDSKPSEQMLQFIRDNYDKWTEERLSDFGGKTLSQMDEDEAKDFIYVAIQSGEIDKSYLAGLRVGGGITGESGRRFGMTVGTGNMIKKVVSVFRDGSLQNISDNIGNEAKVRSFYNNILMPWSDRGEITADTWALRDFFLGMNPKYSEEMRGILFQGQGGAGTGLTAVINEGFRIAADIISAESDEQYLPQQIQSIVWTGIKAAWDNASKDGKRDALNAAWESGDVDTIRSIFTDLINRYQPDIDVDPAIEGQTLSRRGENATIFKEGTSSAQYNNLGEMIAESYQNTRQAAERYQQAGGRESLNESVLFSLSPAKQAEVLQARKDEIKRAVESGIYVSTEYLNEFRGEPWADLELELRDWMAENPEVVSMAREADSLDDFKKKYNEKYNSQEGEQAQEDQDEDSWLDTIYRYSNASSLEDRDRQFVAEWTSSEDKTLELAKTLRDYMNSTVTPGARSRAGYSATRSMYNSFSGISQKVRTLQDGSKKNTKRATSEQIQEAQKLISENPRAYRNAYLLATSNGDTSSLELIDDDIAREVYNIEQEQENARTLKTDYRANIKDLRQKISDAERDIRKAGEDPETLDVEATTQKLEDAKSRVRELNEMIRNAEDEISKMIERMGNDVEKVNDKLEERRARVKELRGQLTEANIEKKRLTNALDAFTRWKEAKLASDYRKKRIKQIKSLSEFNPASIDAIYADSLNWVSSLFDVTDEVREERRSLTDQIAILKKLIEAAKVRNEDYSALNQRLLYLRNQKKQSGWVTPPAQLAKYLPDLLVRSDNRPSSWTAEELDNLLTALKQMRHDGKTMLEAKQNERTNRLLGIGYQYFLDRVGRMGQLAQSTDRVGNTVDFMASWALEKDINESLAESEDPKAFKSFVLSYAKLQRLARILDGDKEGVLYDWFVRENYKHQGEELTQIRRRMEGAQAKWNELGIKAKDLSKEGFKGTKQNGTEYTLTRGQMIGVYVYSLNEIGKEKLMHYNGNNISEADINDIVSQLTGAEKAWGDYMMQDFEDNWQRLADVYYNGWNMVLGKRDNYFTFVPSEAASEAQLENGMDPQGDIVGKDGKVYTNKSFTKEINPNAVYPLELDVTRSWNWQVRKQEHFIAYGQWAKDTQYLFDQSQIINLAERTIGKEAATNFKKIVNFVIGGEMSNNDFDKAYTKWLAKRNSAVLIGNVGTILKQGPSWFAGFNGDINVSEVLKNAVAANATLRTFLADHPGIAENLPGDVDTATQFIWANAPEMKNRQIDMDIAEQLARMDGNKLANLFNPASAVIAKYTIGLVDRLVVNNLWMAKYYTEFDSQKKAGKTDAQAHKEAVFKASQFISETQPTSMRMDQSAKQIDAKSSSFLRGIMVFTNQIVNTYNQLYVDVPMALRQKNYKKAIKTIASTVVMMATVGLLSGRFWKKGDEDDEKYKWRVAREILATVAQVSAPGFGSIVATVIDYGEYNSYIFGLDTIASSARSLLTPSDRTSGWEKLADVMTDLATEAGYAVGAPVTPLKNIVKSVEKGDAGYLLGGTWGQIIESYR